MARSSSSGQCESVATYMDGIRVKIAEVYQQPPRLEHPPAYYAKLPDPSKCTYDFDREKRLLEKITAWRKARISATGARCARVEEKRKKEDKKSPPPPSSPNSQDQATLPVQTPSVSEVPIFTPQPSSTNGIEKFQFNYSEFDVDTSSPFDNMELKTINDMEALAQVLQQPTTSQWAPSPSLEALIKDLKMDQNVDEVRDEDKSVNEFKENAEAANSNKTSEVKQSAVSLIVQELQKELDRPTIENQNSWSELANNSEKHLEVIKEKPSFDPKELAKTLADFPIEDQTLAKRLSDMGFSLPRVTRAIYDLKGQDKKKIVEYLLAIQSLEDFGMSEDEAVKALAVTQNDKHKAKVYYESLCTLRDLGFPEDKASMALLKCDIDRDRALDMLIA